MNFHLKLRDSEKNFIANFLLKSILFRISRTTLKSYLQLQIKRQKLMGGLTAAQSVALTIVMCHLTTGICSEKCSLGDFVL